MSSGSFWSEWSGQPDDILPYSGASTATYPPIKPVGRSYSFGEFAVSRESNLSGNTIKFLHSDYSHALVMTLEYKSLTQSEIARIRDHYRGQDGTTIPFLLPAEIWAGHTASTNLVPTGTRWRYQDAPAEQHEPGGYVNASIALLTADNWLPSPSPAVGIDLAISVLWSPGAATIATGSALIITASLTAGAASGNVDEDAGFAGHLYWTQDLYTDWR